MEIRLNYEQWKRLKELLKVAEIVEMKTTTGDVTLADQQTSIQIYEDITITIPD